MSVSKCTYHFFHILFMSYIVYQSNGEPLSVLPNHSPQHLEARKSDCPVFSCKAEQKKIPHFEAGYIKLYNNYKIRSQFCCCDILSSLYFLLANNIVVALHIRRERVERCLYYKVMWWLWCLSFLLLCWTWCALDWTSCSKRYTYHLFLHICRWHDWRKHTSRDWTLWWPSFP